MAKKNILIFPAEGSNAIELHDALSTCVNINVYGASSIERHGKYVFEKYISNLPLISEVNFIEKFNTLLDEYSIDFVFPTHDTVVLFLAQNKDKIHAQIIGDDLYTATVCRSKIKTYELFSDCDFVPRRIVDVYGEVDYPLFAKPDEGEGGKGATKICKKEELEKIDFASYLVTEYLPGVEYTVDCLTDKNGKLLFLSPRTRERLLAGVSVAGKTMSPTSEINQIAYVINSRLHFIGLWYFQLRQDREGKLKLLEVSQRCAGTMCLTRSLGINLPLLSVYIAAGEKVSVFCNSYIARMDRALVGKYQLEIDYDTVYIDFDDTITLNDELNLTVIRFLYQCRNKKKCIKLLTRHIYDIQETLKRYALSENLFNDIIFVSEGEDKSSYINPSAAIFIDNAYKERMEVYSKYHIPVFDVDGVEFLLDWRF